MELTTGSPLSTGVSTRLRNARYWGILAPLTFPHITAACPKSVPKASLWRSALGKRKSSGPRSVTRGLRKTRWKGAQTLPRKPGLLMCSSHYTELGQQRADESNTAALLRVYQGRHWSRGWRGTGRSSHPFTAFLHNLLFKLQVV